MSFEKLERIPPFPPVPPISTETPEGRALLDYMGNLGLWAQQFSRAIDRALADGGGGGSAPKKVFETRVDLVSGDMRKLDYTPPPPGKLLQFIFVEPFEIIQGVTRRDLVRNKVTVFTTLSDAFAFLTLRGTGDFPSDSGIDVINIGEPTEWGADARYMLALYEDGNLLISAADQKIDALPIQIWELS